MQLPSLPSSAWPVAHLAAIESAAQVVPPARVDLVSDHSWATTYRLSGTGGNAFLKLLPATQHPQIPRLVALAAALPASGPAVLAADPAAGWILLADHGGRDTRSYDADDERPTILRYYATLQAEAARDPVLLARFDTVDPPAAPQLLLDFLRGRSDRSVGAGYFIGPEPAQRYLRLLERRLPLLAPLLEAARALPPTICHGDFQPRNVAMRERRDPVIFDWDDASAGPAGLCLHGMLDGCAAAVIAVEHLRRGGEAARLPLARALNAYVLTLTRLGYAPRRVLLDALPGALVAGTIGFIVNFGRFPGEASRQDSGETIARKCDELLDVCDWLACRDQAAASAAADEYERDGEWHRAQRLVQDQMSRLDVQPVDLLLRYARLSAEVGQPDAAEQACREIIERAPASVEALALLGRLLMERLELEEGGSLLERALALQPRHRQARADLRRVRELARLRRVSLSPRGWPRLRISAEERRRGWLGPETRAMAVEIFRRQGAVQLDGVLEPAYVEAMQRRFFERYREHFHDGGHPDALQVGDKRYMLTVELDELFGAPQVIASTLLMPVIRELVGEQCILSAYTAVASLPGSVDQNIHLDHVTLFEKDAPELKYPSFAAQVIVPLVPLDALTGATRIIKGAQWLDLAVAAQMPHQDPVVPLGSCLINDYLCPHYGRGNRSDVVRPIVTYIYTRPWFKDYLNYQKQPPLRLAPGFLDRAPEEVRSLLAWWERERRLATRYP